MLGVFLNYAIEEALTLAPIVMLPTCQIPKHQGHGLRQHRLRNLQEPDPPQDILQETQPRHRQLIF